MTSATPIPTRSPLRLLRYALITLAVLLVLALAGLVCARLWLRHTAQAALPQLDGTLHVDGLAAPVTLLRDAQGAVHLRAANYDDLLFAQGFVTAQDRLFQMDLLRRHGAGSLAEILGPALIPHDKLQRTLQIRAAADAALKQLPPDQLHMLERYAAGVNASIEAQSAHLSLDFVLVNARPAPWTPRDSLLVALVMFQDLTTGYPAKLAREDLSARLTAKLGPTQANALLADLYPVGSWRDHPPSQPVPDLTIEGPPIEQVPLDESQSVLHPEAAPLATHTQPLLAALLHQQNDCPQCRPGSNNWVVSGAHTATGKPLLSNDMHLTFTVPGFWYEADLEAPSPTGGEPFHAAGVTLPGVPLVIVGHNQHIAWGFTNLGADVQDVYLETLRGDPGHREFRAADGSWQPVTTLDESISVKGRLSTHLTVEATRHGGVLCPILTPLLPHETRPLALRWTLYDPAILKLPFFAIDTAQDWPSFRQAFSSFGGPAQNVVYADDQGHIGYQAVGAIPLRGPSLLNAPAALAPQPSALPQTTPDPTDIPAPAPSTALQLSGALSAVPVVASPANEWSGYIPYNLLPRVFDPPGGVIATANARITPNDYPYPITLDWGDPYRNDRIWKLLGHRKGLKPADMLALQMDIYSDFDHVLAQRLAYALDHSNALTGKHYSDHQTKSLRQAADLLRTFNGRMYTDSSAAAITYTMHRALWAQLLAPRLGLTGKRLDDDTATLKPLLPGGHDYALEQILMHQPPRWLPPTAVNWNDFLTDTLERALTEAHAPSDLSTWRFGKIHTLEATDPILGQSAALRTLLGLPAGTGDRPISGDADTIKQVGHAFGPSERFTADLADPDHTTLNVTLGQSGNPASPHFLDQLPAWLNGATYPFAFTDQAARSTATHILTLEP